MQLVASIARIVLRARPRQAATAQELQGGDFGIAESGIYSAWMPRHLLDRSESRSMSSRKLIA